MGETELALRLCSTPVGVLFYEESNFLIDYRSWPWAGCAQPTAPHQILPGA